VASVEVAGKRASNQRTSAERGNGTTAAAGARSLLVSHWSIASEATVELTTGFLTALRESPNVRRAQALQKSMLKMLDSGDDS
jgi:CHAT domain-containing protein